MGHSLECSRPYNLCSLPATLYGLVVVTSFRQTEKSCFDSLVQSTYLIFTNIVYMISFGKVIEKSFILPPPRIQPSKWFNSLEHSIPFSCCKRYKFKETNTRRKCQSGKGGRDLMHLHEEL